MDSGGDYPNSKEYEEEKRLYRNVMGWGEYQDHLWGWQAEYIYRSYWCNGSRPTNWWIHQLSTCNRSGDCSLNW